MKLKPEQKAYIKGLDKSKHRKEQKRQFKLQNKFEEDKEMAELVIEASKRLEEMAINIVPKCKIVIMHNPYQKVNWVYEYIKSNQK